MMNVGNTRKAGLFARLVAHTGLQHWSLYHRVALIFLCTIVILSVYQAWYAYVNGTYIVKRSEIIQAAPVKVWNFIIQPENRVRWQAHVIDTNRLKGDPTLPTSTRLIFWRDQNRRRWSAFEETVEVVPGLYYATNQKSQKDERSLAIRIEPVGACATRVTLEERIRHELYIARLTSPLTRGRDSTRLESSFDALARWVEKDTQCPKE